MDAAALDKLIGELVANCHAASRAAHLAAESLAGASPSMSASAAYLAETADLIKAMEDRLVLTFLGAPTPVKVFGGPPPPDPPPPPPDPPSAELLALRALPAPGEVSQLIHDLRGIRALFSFGIDLVLGPADMEPLVQGAATTTRRLEPLLRHFADSLKARAVGEVES